MSSDFTIDGVIPINKPAGMTSHDVVAKLRRILSTKKVGHTGTLDPQVTGVLPICIGKATRLSDYIMDMPKTYKCQLTLGIATSTQDFTGDVIEEKKVEKIDSDTIESIFTNFIGEIEQIPPMYSAVKVDGKKLYELARKGKEIERKSRKITIYDIVINEMILDKDYPRIDFTVRCSKGTYIRTLCVDVGQAIGYPAHMSKLTRLESGSFTLEDSFTIEEVEESVKNSDIKKTLTSMADTLTKFPGFIFDNDTIERKIFNGQKIEVVSNKEYDGLIKVLDNKGNLIALYKKESKSDYAVPVKVFK